MISSIIIDVILVSVVSLPLTQELEQLEMVFDEDKGKGGGMLRPAEKGVEFGVLPEPSVMLHAMNSSE